MDKMKVTFPGLGWEFDISRVFVKLGNFEIMWYAIFIVTGFVLALCYALKSSKRFRLNNDKFLDVVILGLILGVVGARLYYVVFNFEPYKHDLLKVFAIHEGGLAIYGGVIGAVVAAIIGSKWRKLDFFSMMDVVSIGFLIGQCLGRWGNFTNQEAFGRGTDLPWGMQSVNTLAVVPDSPVHPCFFYESMWCLAGFILLHLMSKKFYKFRGQIFLSYAVWYGAGRAWIEGLRTDSLYILPGLRVSQLLAIACVIAGTVFLYLGFTGRMFDRVDENFRTIKLKKAASADGVTVEAEADETEEVNDTKEEN